MAVTGMLSGLSPEWVPRLCLQCIAGPLGGVSATVLTTPLDAIRARIQVITVIVIIHCCFYVAFIINLLVKKTAIKMLRCSRSAIVTVKPLILAFESI